MSVVLDGISSSSFGVTCWSFPAMSVWFEVINPLYRDGMRRRCPNQRRQRCHRRDDAVC